MSLGNHIPDECHKRYTMLSSKLFSLSFLFIACSLGVAASPFAAKSNSTSSDNTTDHNNAPPSNSTPTDNYPPPSSSTSIDNSTPTDNSSPTCGSPPPDNSTMPNGPTRWTWYDLASDPTVSCAGFDGNTIETVALSEASMSTDLCGKTIQMTYNGVIKTAKIWDTCPGCPANGLDLSEGLFQQFANEDVGVIFGTWEFA